MKMSWKPDPEEEAAKEKADGKKPFVQIEEYDEPLEEESMEEQARPIVLWQCVYETLTIILLMAIIATGWRKVTIEMLTDPNWIRLAFIVVVPAQMWLALVSDTFARVTSSHTNQYSSFVKLLSVTLLKSLVPLATWKKTRSTIPERRLAVSIGIHSALCPTSLFKCLCTRRVFALSLSPLFAPSSRPCPPTNSRAALPTFSLTTTVCS
jgi:hypothetical protein